MRARFMAGYKAVHCEEQQQQARREPDSRLTAIKSEEKLHSPDTVSALDSFLTCMCEMEEGRKEQQLWKFIKTLAQARLQVCVLGCN